jgi:predicted NUDIX family phosphoesterase
MAKPEVTIAIDKAEVFYRLPASAEGLIEMDVRQFFKDVSRYGSVQERELLESDRTKLHPINYNAVVRVTRLAGEAKRFEFLVYQRPAKGNGESRLAGNHSIGIGGHPDRSDVVYNENDSLNLYATAVAGAKRENQEEVTLSETPSQLRFLGLIYDPSNDVGRYHLGVFGILFVSADCTATSNENQILNPHWVDVDAIHTGDYNFESWSSIVLAGLEESVLYSGAASAQA